MGKNVIPFDIDSLILITGAVARRVTLSVLQAVPDEGGNALLASLLPDLQEVGHAHAHQPDLDRQLCL